MVGFAEFKDIIKTNYSNIQTYRENVLENVSNTIMNCLKDMDIDDKRKDYCDKKSKELFHNIFTYCEKLELTENNILDYYSDINILYIDSTTKLPLQTNKTTNKDNIILLKYPDNTYEVIGKLYKNNIVARMFSSYDNIYKQFVVQHKRSSSSSPNDKHKRSSSSSSSNSSSPNDKHKRISKPRKIINLFKSSSEN